MWSQSFSKRSPKDGSDGLALYLLLVLGSCFMLLLDAQARELRSVCVTDHASRPVCLSLAPRRVISLAPSLTETVFALDAGNLLMGKTASCNYPPEAAVVPVVGAYMNPDLERVIDMKPDLVLAPLVGTKKEFLARLAVLGIPVFIDDCRNLDDIRDLVAKLGRLLAREVEAERIIDQFDRQRRSVQERIKNQGCPSVLFAVGSSPLVVAGGNSFLGAIIREARGNNIAETDQTPFPRINIEEVIRKDPDIILVLDKECLGDRCIDEWRRHHHLKAIKEGRIYVMGADLMARPSPRIVQGLRQLAEILHSCAFTRNE